MSGSTKGATPAAAEPWPPAEVLALLAQAADHLLRVHHCEHGVIGNLEAAIGQAIALEAAARSTTPTTSEGIGEAWASYVAALLDPAGAGEVQREETKRAFYAGAAAMFSAMLNAAELEEDPAAARVEALDRELVDYLRLFKTREGIKS